MSSPTKRSLDHLRDERGLFAHVVEKWNSFAKVRIDMFGWVDIVAVDRWAIIGVQTTTYSNMGARLKKVSGNKALTAWLQAGGRLELHGWRKVKNRWQVEVQQIHLDDLMEECP